MLFYDGVEFILFFDKDLKLTSRLKTASSASAPTPALEYSLKEIIKKIKFKEKNKRNVLVNKQTKTLTTL